MYAKVIEENKQVVVDHEETEDLDVEDTVGGSYPYKNPEFLNNPALITKQLEYSSSDTQNSIPGVYLGSQKVSDNDKKEFEKEQKFQQK